MLLFSEIHIADTKLEVYRASLRKFLTFLFHSKNAYIS